MSEDKTSPLRIKSSLLSRPGKGARTKKMGSMVVVTIRTRRRETYPNWLIRKKKGI